MGTVDANRLGKIIDVELLQRANIYPAREQQAGMCIADGHLQTQWRVVSWQNEG